jgi:hypothetical protein
VPPTIWVRIYVVPYHHRTCKISCTVPPLHPGMHYLCAVQYSKKTLYRPAIEDYWQSGGPGRTVLCSICLSSLHCSWEHKQSKEKVKFVFLSETNFKHSKCCMHVIKRQLRGMGSTPCRRVVSTVLYKNSIFKICCRTLIYVSYWRARLNITNSSASILYLGLN